MVPSTHDAAVAVAAIRRERSNASQIGWFCVNSFTYQSKVKPAHSPPYRERLKLFATSTTMGR